MSGNCSLTCPALTVLVHDGTQFTCSFTQWAYGLAAALIAIGGLLPIALLICFWAKLKNATIQNKGRLRRQDSEASTFTDVSRPHDHGVYEVLRDDHNEDVLYRTRKGVFPQHKYGTFSVPNFRTFDQQSGNFTKGLYPDLTQVHTPRSYHTTPASSPTGEGNNHQVSSYQSDEIVPRKMSRKRQRKQHYSYDDVSNCVDPKFVKFARDDKGVARTSDNSTPNRYLRKSRSDLTSSDKMTSSTSSSTDGLSMDKDRSTPVIIPQGQNSSNCSENVQGTTKCLCFQPTPPVKHLVEGIDFDLYLKDCVGKLPEDQRNGTFLVRDSQSSVGCKVLVVYCRGLYPSNLLYHYKVCFTLANEVFLQGSMKMFPTIDSMIDDFRTSRTVLPCLLSNCLGKNF